MEKLISIVIPVYNVGKYLRQCLDSVTNQTYKNLEILVVDDGSTDDSGKICDEYARKDERISVFHTDNHGLSAARNYAIDRANGEYIAFLDSDDWFEENAIERFLDVAMTTDADIVACRFYQEFITETGESEGAKEQFVVEGGETLKTVVLDRRITNDVWNKFYRIALFSDIRYPVGRIFEDIATTYKLIQKAYRLAYIPDCLIHYRNRESSLSNVHSKSLIDYWIVYRERFENLGYLSDEYYRVTLSDSVAAVSRMWRWYAGCSKEEKRESKKRADEMQAFVTEHRGEILGDSHYSRYVKAACLYAKHQNAVLFRLLYLSNKLYRKANRHSFFEK